MINDTVLKALNDQINNELYSAYMYLALATYFNRKALTGFANWMLWQSREELEHAKKLYDFMDDNDAPIEFREIRRPRAEFESPEDAMRTALEAEQDNTEQINDLYELAVNNKDHATEVLMQWFIQEQVEEEKNARTLLERLRLAGSDKAALLMLDMELAKRADTESAVHGA